MTNDIDHDHCSELLGAYVRGGLGMPQHVAVERHLEGCSECQAEHDALRALRADEVKPLNDAERTALRHGVRAGVHPGDATVVPLRRRERGAQLLGAAALIAVLVAGLFYLGSGAGRHERDVAGVASEDGGGGGEPASAPGPARRDRTLESTAEGTEAQGAAHDEVEAQPTFAAGAGEVGRRALRHLGSGKQLRSLSHYDASEVGRVQRELTLSLAERAPDELADQVESCARRVYARSEERALPAYGTTGEVHGRRVLVLGFAYSNAAAGPLDRFMFWVWRRGECAPPVDYEQGPIRTGP
jgi:Putative zinc-finger